jgi:hypothetical protein
MGNRGHGLAGAGRPAEKIDPDTIVVVHVLVHQHSDGLTLFSMHFQYPQQRVSRRDQLGAEAGSDGLEKHGPTV